MQTRKAERGASVMFASIKLFTSCCQSVSRLLVFLVYYLIWVFSTIFKVGVVAGLAGALVWAEFKVNSIKNTVTYTEKILELAVIMEFHLKETRQGSSVIVTVLLNCCRNYEKVYSHKIDINGLAFVQFSFQQLDYNSVQNQIMIQKQQTDFTIKVKASSPELSYSSDMICTEEGCWDIMGSKWHDIYINVVQQVNQFTVTLCAYKTGGAFEQLYKEIDFTNFHVTSDEGSVPIHKACLAAHSEVFKKMLTQKWKETDEGSMELPGITLQTLQHLKLYLYLGTLPDDGLIPLLELASCYLIQGLKEKCVSKLAWNVKPEDFYSLLQYSMDSKIPELTFALMQISPQGVVEKARKINVIIE